MSRAIFLLCVFLVAFSFRAPSLQGQAPTKSEPTQQSEFRTVDKVLTAKGKPKATINRVDSVNKHAYLGISLDTNKAGELIVNHVDENSPAAKAKVQLGDVVSKMDGQAIENQNALAERIHDAKEGQTIKLSILRKKKPQELSIKLGATSRPFAARTFNRFGRPLLGVGIGKTPEKKKGALVTQIRTGYPAAKAGIRSGDLLVKVNDKELKEGDDLRKVLTGTKYGQTLVVVLERKAKTQTVKVKLFNPTKQKANVPNISSSSRPILGVNTREAPKGKNGVFIAGLIPGFPAQKAGIKVGDLLVKVNNIALKSTTDLRNFLIKKKPNDEVALKVLRDDKEVDIKLKLASSSQSRKRRSFDFRKSRYFSRPVYKLAVVRVSFPDVEPNKKITAKDWEQSLFSKGVYNKKSVTGQTVYGSLNDYYLEQSYGKFRVEGKVFDHVEVKDKRETYATGSKRRVFFKEALDALLKREGKDALDGFDGLFFMYAGGRAKIAKGSLYWPHRASTSYNGKRWGYFICPEGDKTMNSISVIAHEFGHMLGLPDLYPRGSDTEGVGIWCTMSVGHGRSGRPYHFCAWSKEKLGWLKPVTIDPTVKQKIRLRPVQTGNNECIKILLRPDAREYLLLENRSHKGFDAKLPGEGLLIWRVIANRPRLQESHGIIYSSGPRQFLSSVPYPSKANNAFTPYTVPSSRPETGDGVPVHITNIQRLPNGDITFFVGYEIY